MIPVTPLIRMLFTSSLAARSFLNGMSSSGSSFFALPGAGTGGSARKISKERPSPEPDPLPTRNFRVSTFSVSERSMSARFTPRPCIRPSCGETDDLQFLDDGADGHDVGDRGDLDLERDLLDPVVVAAVLLLDVDGHHRGRRDAPRVDELDEPREAERHVHLGDAGVVERPQRHLRARLADRLGGDDAHRFMGVDAGLGEPHRDLVNDLLELRRLEPEVLHAVVELLEDERRKDDPLGRGELGDLARQPRRGLLFLLRHRYSPSNPGPSSGDGTSSASSSSPSSSSCASASRSISSSVTGGVPPGSGRLLVEGGLDASAQRHRDDLVQRDGQTAVPARRVDAVLAVLVLDDRAGGVAYRPVLVDVEVLEGVDQPALHVAGPARPHGRVDQTLPPSHGVEEVFRRRQAALVVRGDESAGVGAQVAAAIVRQRPVEESPHEALAPDGLPPNGAGHLRQVEHRPARAGRARMTAGFSRPS